MERFLGLEHSSACFRHLLLLGGSHCVLSCTFVINCFEIIDYSSFSSDSNLDVGSDQDDYKQVIAAYSYAGNFTNLAY